MIEEAEKNGELKKGYVIVEPTSGNTGIGLALIGKIKGYKVKIVMPDSMSAERRNIIKSYGAELVLTDGKEGMKGAIEKAYEIKEKEGNVFIPNQFSNESNFKAHYDSTSLEILRDFEKIDAFVAGVGTGGTITGIGKRFKEKDKKIEIIAVEPYESSVISGGTINPHKIQGIGAGFIPKILDVSLIDRTIRVKSDEAVSMVKKLLTEEGLFVGISSAANVIAAMEVAKELGKGKTVITVSPDSGDKYISMGLFY
jgi:cysteine synthase A